MKFGGLPWLGLATSWKGAFALTMNERSTSYLLSGLSRYGWMDITCEHASRILDNHNVCITIANEL